MMGLFFIAARNLKRSWFRTIFTVLGAAVALIAFVMLRTLLWSWNAGAENAAQDRLGCRHKVSFVMQLPKKYIDDIRGVPGIKEATFMNWTGHRLANKPDEFFGNFAADSETVFKVYDEVSVSEEDKQRWMSEKNGAIVGHVLAKKMGWKVGDKVTLEGTIYPGNWDFTISGIYHATRKSFDDSSFFFHWNYLNESLPPGQRDTIGWVAARVTDDKQSADISKRVDALFEERDIQTVTMSERAMMVGFMAGFDQVLKALDVVSIVILVIMLLILGNTIAMGVRERTREYAVLRAIGFEPGHVRFFVIAEALTLGVVAGAVGIGLAYPFVNGFVGKALEENMGAWFPYFRVQPETAIAAVVIAVVLATLASLIPSIQAGRVSVTDALRRVG